MQNTRYHKWAAELQAGILQLLLAQNCAELDRVKLTATSRIIAHYQHQLEAEIRDRKLLDPAAIANLAAMTELCAEMDMEILEVTIPPLPKEELWKRLEAAAADGLPAKREARPAETAFLDPSVKAKTTPYLRFAQVFGSVLPRRRDIERLAEQLRDKTVLEIGAGAALWARLLAEEGVDIVCTDSFQQADYSASFFPLEKMDWVEAVRTYPRDVMLAIMPGNRDGTLWDAIELFAGNDILLVTGFPQLLPMAPVLRKLAEDWLLAGQLPLYAPVDLPDPRMCPMLLHWRRAQ